LWASTSVGFWWRSIGPGDGRRLARSGGAQERLIAQALGQTLGQAFYGLGLVAGRFEVGDIGICIRPRQRGLQYIARRRFSTDVHALSTRGVRRLKPPTEAARGRRLAARDIPISGSDNPSMTYLAAPNRYDSMPYRRSGGVACCCRPSRSACGRTSGTNAPSRASAPSSAAPSTWGSHTSTWPTTTACRPDRPRRTSGGPWPPT